MNKLIVLVALLLSMSTLGFGTAVPVCDKATLTDYIADGGSCAVGNVVFSSFSYSSLGSVPVSSSNIRVIPTIVPGEFGLRFVGPWWAGGTRTKESVIDYSVEGALGFALDDAFLDMAKFGIDKKKQGSVSVVESAEEKSGVLFVGDSSSGVTSSDSVAFPKIGKLTISDDITVAGNGKGRGYAQVLEVTNLYSTALAIPEPASMLLFGSGLLGVLGAARRKWFG